MNFIKGFFNYNSFRKQNSKTIRNQRGGEVEKDAALVDSTDLANKKGSIGVSNLSSMATQLSNSVQEEFLEPNIENSYMDSLPLSEHISDSNNSELNTINVHNADQQVVMQISNVSSLHFGSVYNISNNTPVNTAVSTDHKLKNEKDKTKFNKKTTTIELMMKSSEEPNYRMLDTIATHLGSGWRQVMRELGYSEGQISSSELDNHIHGTKEVIYQLLLDWMSTAEDELRNVGYLTKLLWNCGHRECVYRMKMTWKSELDSKNN